VTQENQETVEEVVEQAGDEQAAQAEAQRQADEGKARNQGWRPKEEFRGDPAKWVDAAEFNRRGEEHIPILRANLERTRQELDETKRIAKEAVDFQRQLNERDRRRLQGEIDALNQQKLAAVSSGDTQAYLASEHGIKLRSEQMPPAEQARPAQPEIPAEVRDFATRNPWITSDPELGAAAQAFHVGLQNHPDTQFLPLAENLRRTEEHIRRMYPEKFGNPRRNLPGTVEGAPALGAGSKPRKKGYIDLPAEARAACDKFVAQKLMSRDQYLSDYFGEQQ
jgi:hypothetical protein